MIRVEQTPSPLRHLIGSFIGAEPLVQVWRHVPDVPDGADDQACDEMSERFTAHLRPCPGLS